MGHSLVSKDEVCNVILAAQRITEELAKRAPSSVEMEAYLDGFTTALEVIATGLGVDVTIQRPDPNVPRKWNEVWDALPAFVFGEKILPAQNEE